MNCTCQDDCNEGIKGKTDLFVLVESNAKRYMDFRHGYYIKRNPIMLKLYQFVQNPADSHIYEGIHLPHLYLCLAAYCILLFHTALR